jgi:hypothetical protein
MDLRHSTDCFARAIKAKCKGIERTVHRRLRRDVDDHSENAVTKTLTLPNISCPACRCTRVCKGEYEGIIEQTILRLVRICPFLCQACDMRFYMFLAASALPQPESLHSWLDAERCKSIVSPN